MSGVHFAVSAQIMGSLTEMRGTWFKLMPPDYTDSKEMGEIEVFGTSAHRLTLNPWFGSSRRPSSSLFHVLMNATMEASTRTHDHELSARYTCMKKS